MAIGDKIDWRAGTIDPTTLQLIASAGAAQGAMYQSLGDSVSKALEKDSEDYIVAAGKAFDKANELYDIEDGEDFNHEKYNKLTKKGINLFRKAGEKYNIISGGWESGTRLMTEEDIHKFYGFDPDRPLPRAPVPLRKKGDVSEQVGPREGSLVEGPEEKGERNYVEDAMAAKKPPPFQPNIEAIRSGASTESLSNEDWHNIVPSHRMSSQDAETIKKFGFGSGSSNMASIAEGGLNPISLLQSDVGIPEFVEQMKDLPPKFAKKGQALIKNILADLDGSEPINYKELLGFLPSNVATLDGVSGQQIVDMGAQAVIERDSIAFGSGSIPGRQTEGVSVVGDSFNPQMEPTDSLREMNVGEDWINPQAEGVSGFGDFLMGGAKKALDFVQYIGGIGKHSDLGPATFTPTGGTLNEGSDQPNPFYPTLDSLKDLEPSYSAEEQLYFNPEDKTVNYGRRGQDGKPLIDYELIPREIR